MLASFYSEAAHEAVVPVLLAKAPPQGLETQTLLPAGYMIKHLNTA